MEYIKGTTKFHIEEQCVISLGKFDGLHRGHELLMEYIFQKKKMGLKATIFTFDISPRRGKKGQLAKVLTTNEEKLHIFRRIGIDYLVECPFTPEVMNMEPEDFIKMIVKNLNVKYMVVGTDFHFGHNRRGDFYMLQEYAPRLEYEVQVVDKMQYKGRDISSTYVREEVTLGNMEKANMLLGYKFFVQGIVVHGRHIGTQVLGIPTINIIPPENKLLPPFGVYVAEITIRGNSYQGITNVGCKPTIDGNNPIGIETHIFDFHEDVYDEKVRVKFLSRVREEIKFNSIDELKEQMKYDIIVGKKFFKQ